MSQLNQIDTYEKNRMRAEIDRQVNEFLSAGGVIDIIEVVRPSSVAITGDIPHWQLDAEVHIEEG